MRLGYEVLVKLKVDDLLERDSLPTAVEDDQPSRTIRRLSRERLQVPARGRRQ
jgi:hypothetical protein